MQVRPVGWQARTNERDVPDDRIDSTEVVRAGPPPRRPVHGRARHRDRERRASVHPDRPRVLAGEPPVGRQRLRAALRRLPSTRRPCRRPVRPATVVRRRNHRLHPRVAGVGVRVGRGLADRGPRAAGARRRADHAGGALDPHHDVRRRQGAERSARCLGRRRRVRRSRRRAARRSPHRRAELGVDLLRQRAGRAPRARARTDPPDGEPRCTREELRRARSGARHRRARRARLRDHAGEQLRLGIDRDDRALHGCARHPRRVRCVGVAHGRAADAVLDLPAADGRGREHRRADHGHRDVRDVPDADALHAAGARLLGDEDRRGLPRGGRARRSSGRRSPRSSSTASA